MSLIQNYIGELLAALITGFGLWFFERRRRAQDIHEHNISIYQNLLDDMKKRFDEKQNELKQEIEKLIKEKDHWKTRCKQHENNHPL